MKTYYMFAKGGRGKPHLYSFKIFETLEELENYAIEYTMLAKGYLEKGCSPYYGYNQIFGFIVDNENDSKTIRGFQDNIWEKTKKKYEQNIYNNL